MAGILSWLNQPKATPPFLVETDEIVPVHYFDNTAMNRQIIVCWTLRFGDVLMVDKVHSSLCQLLEMGDWRKLGGRLRMNDAGKLEVHIPRPFTKKRPAVRHSHAEFSMTVQEHPIASKLPRRTNEPSLQAGPEAFRSLGSRMDMPTCLADYLCSDEPQLQLHTVSFTNATLVSITWPHVTSDAMGMQALASAWSLVMAGKVDQVPEYIGLKEDPLAPVGIAEKHSSRPPLITKYQLEGWALLRALWRFIPSHLWWPAKDNRTIFLPAKTVQRLRQSALADLPGTDEPGNKPFLSENDVVTAWLSRMASSHIPANSSQNILIQNVYDLRSRLSVLVDQAKCKGGVFVQNLTAPIVAVLPATQVLDRPLGAFALDLRRTIVEQVTEDQTESLFRLFRESYAVRGRAPIFGAPDAYWIFFTSWTKCKVWETIDFSPAIVKARSDSGVGLMDGDDRSNKAGRPDYFHSFPVRTPPLSPNGFQVAGKDCAGNYWAVGNLQEGLWKDFEDEIKRLAFE